MPHNVCREKNILQTKCFSPYKQLFSIGEHSIQVLFFFLCYKRLKRFSVLLLFLYLSSYLFKVCRRVSKFDSPEKCLWGNFLHLASPSPLHKGYDFEKRFSKTYANKDLIARRQSETSLRILSARGVLLVPTPHYAKKFTD